VKVEDENDNTRATHICIKCDKALFKRSGLRLTTSLPAAPANAYGDVFGVTILEKTHKYKYSRSKFVEIGGESALEWNYCGSVLTEMYRLYETTFEIYDGKTMIFEIDMRGTDDATETKHAKTHKIVASNLSKRTQSIPTASTASKCTRSAKPLDLERPPPQGGPLVRAH